MFGLVPGSFQVYRLYTRMFNILLRVQEVLSRGDMLQHGILQDLLSLPGWDILDECDQLLSHKFQLVYAWGAQTHLPGLEARVQMAQAVLEALAFDTDCLALLSDPAIAHIQHDQRSFGSLPQIRLISGMPVCLFASYDADGRVPASMLVSAALALLPMKQLRS